MFDREHLVDLTLDEATHTEQSIAWTAVDNTLDAVVGLLRSKSAEHTERGNRIATAVIDDIIKEFY